MAAVLQPPTQQSPTQQSPPLPAPAQMPWAAAGAALVAMTTLLITYGTPRGPNSILLAALMALLLAVRITGRRLPAASWAHWAARAALFAPIIAFNWDKFSDTQSWLFDSTAVGAFGILAAAELVIQAARTLPPGQRNSGALCLLSGYVFLAACTTDQVWPIRIASPLYFGLTVLSLPRFGAAADSQTQPRRGIARRAAAIVGALGLGLSLYGLFWVYRVPLMQIGAGSLHARPVSEASGMTSQPTLGPTFGLRGSRERVLRLQNPQGGPYLRGEAYDTYAQGRWGLALNKRRLTPCAVSTDPPAPADAMRVTTLAPVSGLLFVPLTATGLWLPPGDEAAVRQDTLGGGLFVRTSLPPPYQVSVGPASTPPLLRATLPPAERARDLAVPPDLDPRVAALARIITQAAPTSAGKAAAVEAFFLQNFHYSLSIRPGPGDPVSNFILGRKSAHCEFFASGAALMLRAAGVPARYVTGYYAHEGDGPGGGIVRRQDAHAWTEAWLPGQGWTTVDATPAAGRPPATAEPVLWPQRAAEWVSDKVAAVRAWLAQFTAAQILGALALLALLYAGLRELWKRRHRTQSEAPTFAYHAAAADLDDLARRFDAWLARIGLPCPPPVPWAEHVQVVGLAEAAPFVAAYNAARFGPTLSADTMQECARALSRLEQSKIAAANKAA